MESNFDTSKEVCDKILEQVLSTSKTKSKTRQLHAQMHPIVSNAMFKMENQLLEAERFKTLTILARTLDDESVKKCIVALKYQLTVKK